MKDNEIITLWENCIKMHDKSKKLGVEQDVVAIHYEVAKHTFNIINRLKKENDDLFFKLNGVMWSVDKWLDGEELKQDEVNRAITMREKTLQITEKLQAEVERLQDIIISNDEKRLSSSAIMMKKEQELMHAERISGLEAEIERLKNNISIKVDVDDCLKVVDMKMKQIKSKARKEFAERLIDIAVGKRSDTKCIKSCFLQTE